MFIVPPAWVGAEVAIVSAPRVVGVGSGSGSGAGAGAGAGAAGALGISH
jgi:hypothetical protein